MISLASMWLLSIQTLSPIEGWTEADAFQALQTNHVTEIEKTTTDPSFPNISGRDASGTLVNIVRMACTQTPPTAESSCAGAWISTALATTEYRFAVKIRDSLERHANAPLGVNAAIQFSTDEMGQVTPIIILQTYLVADGGVHPELLSQTISNLLGITDQTREFLLLDDPAHERLWGGQTLTTP